MGGAISVNGVWREVVGAYETVNGVWRETDQIPVTVNGVYRQAYETFNPHIDSKYYSTSSQAEVTGWTVNQSRIQTALNKGYDAIYCHEIEVVEGSWGGAIEFTYTDNTTEIAGSLVDVSEKYIMINNTQKPLKSIRFYYFSFDGNYAGAVAEFDFVNN